MIVSDYVFERLADLGVHNVFNVSGGGIMYLLDALGRSARVKHWVNFHEQACAISAEAYARVTDGLGVCLVTSGPGSTNALSAIAGAWVDSVPVLVLSGQVRTNLIADYSRQRQIGPQEINIVDMARPVTKYATTIMNAVDVPAELDKGIRIATTGRPGPVWLNFPLDIQSASLDPSVLMGVPATPLEDAAPAPAVAEIDEVIRLVTESRRPVIVAGNGVHLAHAEDSFGRFVERVGCPVVTTMGGMDLLPEVHPLYLGRFGPTGQRRANFTLQNADLLLSLGAGMGVKDVGFNTDGLAPRARRAMVNIDPEEMRKANFKVDLGVVADLHQFLLGFLDRLGATRLEFDPRWIAAVQGWKRAYPIVTDDYFEDDEHVNSYVLAAVLGDLMQPGEVLLTGNATDAVSIHHSFAVKAGQRVITNYGFGAMGWDLPAAVGACVARDGERTVLVTGDGSIQLNVQELMTIGHNCLNVKVFVLNNGGYESIRATQLNFFEGRFFGCHADSGVANPDFKELAAAYGLEYRFLRTNADVPSGVRQIIENDGPILCEVNISFDQEKRPKLLARQLEDGTLKSPTLDDQYPWLSEQEHDAVMGLFPDDAGPR